MRVTSEYYDGAVTLARDRVRRMDHVTGWTRPHPETGRGVTPGANCMALLLQMDQGSIMLSPKQGVVEVLLMDE